MVAEPPRRDRPSSYCIVTSGRSPEKDHTRENHLYQGICGGDGWLPCKDVKAMECVLTISDTWERLSTPCGGLVSQSPVSSPDMGAPLL